MDQPVKKGKIIILSAPSGTGKSTIISRLVAMPELHLGFSVSATSRSPRGEEKDGCEYYFLSPEEFDRRIAAGHFVEWEEVYAGTKYGTLREEVERVTGSGRNLVMDIDVKGAVNVKRQFGDNAISIFIKPPCLETLESRLRGRNTDSEESLRKRIEKAGYEMGFADRFDRNVVNDDLDTAVSEVRDIISGFISA